MRTWSGLLSLMTLVVVGVPAGGDRFPRRNRPARRRSPTRTRSSGRSARGRGSSWWRTRLRRTRMRPFPVHPAWRCRRSGFEYDSARFTPLARTQVDELGRALLQPAMLPFRFSAAGSHRQHRRRRLQPRALGAARARGQAAPRPACRDRERPPDRGGFRGERSARRHRRGRRTEPPGGDRQPRTGACRRGGGGERDVRGAGAPGAAGRDRCVPALRPSARRPQRCPRDGGVSHGACRVCSG